MKKKEGRVDDGPVDESFIGSSPHTAVAGAAAAVAKCKDAIIIETVTRVRRRRRVELRYV